jgi:hypothetical protein
MVRLRKLIGIVLLAVVTSFGVQTVWAGPQESPGVTGPQESPGVTSTTDSTSITTDIITYIAPTIIR